ncbi:unnamed protein product [Euphydryas editha]|uniref:DDE-1 domain-containing protein n=1 Tax=Euphydryas editha TaxID=104508 RepID=A0AAU9VC72_EUPED|nr:unnamed protein product [Euphydryas editha]
MPREYKPSRKKNYKRYDPFIIEKALQEYNSSKQSFMQISRKYEIPKSVLHRHNTFVMKQQGGQTALTPEEEDYLVKYINVCSEWGYPLEPIDFRNIVKGYLDKMGIEVKKFKNNMPGPDFMTSFLKRHKNKISSRLSQNIKRSRAAVSPETINEYFGELETSLQGIPPCNIINYDETNLTDDPGRKRVLVKRTVKYPERVMNHTKGSTSIMMAAAADGTLLPPYVVYKAQNMYDTWRQNGPKGCRYNCTQSGWFDGVTFQDWVKTIAMPYFSDKIGTKILIGDNLASHLSIDLIKECEECNIKFVFLPANSTHLTQPLDVAFFRPLKSAWRDILFNWKKTDGRTQATIPKNVFPSLLKKLLKKIDSNVNHNILAGFDKCGIRPINKQKVLDRLPSYTPTELTGFKEVIDETVLSMLKEMRYGTGSQRSYKKKKIDVVAGRSVENMPAEESDEDDLEEASDNDNVTKEDTDNKHDNTDPKPNSKAGCSWLNIEGPKTTTKNLEKLENAGPTKQKINKEEKTLHTTNKTKTEKGMKTTNKSLIKKTKAQHPLKINIKKQNSPEPTSNNTMDINSMPVVFEDFFTVLDEIEIDSSNKLTADNLFEETTSEKKIQLI